MELSETKIYINKIAFYIAMKRQNIDLILNSLRNTEERVISREKIITAIQDAGHTKEAKRALFQLRKRGWIKYIFRGYYYLLTPDEKFSKYTLYTSTEMLFATLNKLKFKWYLGLQSALEYNNVVWQGHSTLVILNNKLSGARAIQGTKVQFKKMKERYFFGIKTMETKNRITRHYSDKEKTLADFAYFAENAPAELRHSINEEKMQQYLSTYSKVVQKRAL
jgi:predicted transcriptional regulator of viral defense system